MPYFFSQTPNFLIIKRYRSPDPTNKARINDQKNVEQKNDVIKLKIYMLTTQSKKTKWKWVDFSQ
jgi:hypothetical protein